MAKQPQITAPDAAGASSASAASGAAGGRPPAAPTHRESLWRLASAQKSGKGAPAYGLLCLIFLALGTGETFYVIYGLMFLASAGYLVLALVRWFLQMATIDKEGAV